MGKKIGRNDPCPCGSGKKYKLCCINKMSEEEIQSDTCGLYDNYWRCFFEMLSTCFDILVGIKNNVDDILYRQYSV